MFLIPPWSGWGCRRMVILSEHELIRELETVKVAEGSSCHRDSTMWERIELKKEEISQVRKEQSETIGLSASLLCGSSTGDTSGLHGPEELQRWNLWREDLQRKLCLYLYGSNGSYVRGGILVQREAGGMAELTFRFCKSAIISLNHNCSILVSRFDDDVTVLNEQNAANSDGSQFEWGRGREKLGWAISWPHPISDIPIVQCISPPLRTAT